MKRYFEGGDIEADVKNDTFFGGVRRFSLAVCVLAVAILSSSITGYSADTSAAGNINELWTKGNEAYSMGEYTNAVKCYSQIEKDGYASSALYYNMGNAFYKMGQNAKAILYYERVLKVDPANSDAKTNLEIARAQTLDKIEAVPGFIFVTWIKAARNILSSNGWARLALILLVITCLLLMALKFGKSARTKKISFIVSCVFFFFTLVSFLFSASLAVKANSTNYAVIMNGIGNVKSAPNSTGNSIFVLHQGTKVKILEKAEGWDKIQINDGRQGWIQTEDIEVI